MANILHDHDKEGMLPKLGHQIVHVYDWLAGPGKSEQERMERILAETEPIRQINRMVA